MKKQAFSWELSGWQLIHTPTWCYDDPIYVRLSDRLKATLGLSETEVILMGVEKNNMYEAEQGGHYLLTISGAPVLASVHYTYSGLDGGGVYYEFDVPATETIK
jgi:hypothetical protein